jgi:hypothetical protein
MKNPFALFPYSVDVSSVCVLPLTRSFSSTVLTSFPRVINSPSATNLDKPIRSISIRIRYITDEAMLYAILTLNDLLQFLDDYGNLRSNTALFLSIRVFIGGYEGGTYTLFPYLRFSNITLDGMVQDLFNEFSDSDEYYRSANHLRVSLFGWISNIQSVESFISSRDLQSSEVSIPIYSIRKHLFPLTMDFHTWGSCTLLDDLTYKIVLDKSYIIVKVDSTHILSHHYSVYSLNHTIRFTFIDLYISSLTHFKRTVGARTWVFNNGDIISYNRSFKKRSISTLKRDIVAPRSFLTLDLECYNDNGNFIVYAAGLYDGIKLSIFYLSDFESSESLIKALISAISKPKYKDWNRYIHNFNGFDLAFLLPHLISMGKVTPRMRDSRVIKLIFTPFKGVKLNLLDSYSILPAKLSNLCDSFNVEVKKGQFTHEFASFNNLNYIGPHPITAEPDWNFRNSLYSYLRSDVISLWQVLDKFRSSLFSKYRLNLMKYPTLPSIAFANYRTNFLSKNLIVTLDGSTVSLTPSELFSLSSLIYETFLSTFPSIKDFYNYLAAWVKIARALDIQLSWITPTGTFLSPGY